MIVITGAAGFIASVVAGCLNEQGREDLVLVDDFSKKQKERNYINKKYQLLLDRKELHILYGPQRNGTNGESGTALYLGSGGRSECLVSAGD